MKKFKKGGSCMIAKKLVIHYFYELFGVEPVEINDDYDDLIQLKFNFCEVKKKQFCIALKRLKKIVKADIVIKILFVSKANNLEMQLIIGEEKAVESLRLGQGTDDIVFTFN